MSCLVLLTQPSICKKHKPSKTSSHSLIVLPSPHSSLKNLPHPLLLGYPPPAGEVSSPLEYLTESLHTCSQTSSQIQTVGWTCRTAIHTPGRWCLLYWHLTLQLLCSRSSKLKSLLWRCLKTPQAVPSPLHQSLRDRFLPHQYQKVFHISRPIRNSHPAPLTACQEENEKLKWHLWSANWRSQQGIHPLFSANRKILHLFQPQSQIKYELMNSQQLTPQIQIFMLKIS